MWLRKYCCVCVCVRPYAFYHVRIRNVFAEIRCYLCLMWKRMKRNKQANKRVKEQRRKDTRRFRQFNKQFCLICYCVHILLCFDMYGMLQQQIEPINSTLKTKFQTAANIYIYHFNLLWNECFETYFLVKLQWIASVSTTI